MMAFMGTILAHGVAPSRRCPATRSNRTRLDRRTAAMAARHVACRAPDVVRASARGDRCRTAARRPPAGRSAARPPRWSEERVTMTEAADSAHDPGTPCWVSLMVHGLDRDPGVLRRAVRLGVRARARSSSARTSGPCSTARRSPGIGRAAAGPPPAGRLDALSRLGRRGRDGGDDPGLRRHGRRWARWTPAEAGRLAIASDPSGAVFGIWQAAAHLGTARRRRARHPGLERAGDPRDVGRRASSTRRSSATNRRTAVRLRPSLDYVTLHSGGRPVAGAPRRGHTPCPATGARTG